MNRNLLILGAGQYGSVVREIALETGAFDEIGYLDDSFVPENTEKDSGRRIIGKLNGCERFADEYAFAVVAMGNPELRREWTGKLRKAGFGIPVIVSPRAYVSPSARLGEGIVVEPLAGINANSTVGSGTYVSMGAVVNHNAAVGDWCHIDCNAVILGGASVPDGVWVGAGRIVKSDP